MMNKKVSIIGMGMLGRAWSIAFARAGCTVIGWDPSTEASNASLKVVDQLLEKQRRERLPEVALKERQLWRDQCLMTLGQQRSSQESANSSSEAAPQTGEV